MFETPLQYYFVICVHFILDLLNITCNLPEPSKYQNRQKITYVVLEQDDYILLIAVETISVRLILNHKL